MLSTELFSTSPKVLDRLTLASMDTLLNTDFGSESEDDNFNPAPAVGSDDDGVEESDMDGLQKPKTNGTTYSRYSPTQEKHSDDGVEEQGSATNGRTSNTTKPSRAEHEGADDDDNEADVANEANGVHGTRDENDEDEDEEEDEDDEDDVSVCSSCRSLQYQPHNR